MFLHLSVSHSVHRGSVSQHVLDMQTPPGQTNPNMHWDRHALGRHIPACTGEDPPGRRLLLGTVRILLECILVLKGIFMNILLKVTILYEHRTAL